jgi:hypothetical protein
MESNLGLYGWQIYYFIFCQGKNEIGLGWNWGYFYISSRRRLVFEVANQKYENEVAMLLQTLLIIIY